MWGEASGTDAHSPARGERLAVRFGLPDAPCPQEIVRWENLTRDLYASGYRLSAAALLAAQRCFRGVGAVAHPDPQVALCTLLPARALQLARPGDRGGIEDTANALAS